MELYSSSFVSSELKNSEADIVYKIKDENVFFIIEHQTRIDYNMPLRIAKYQTQIIESVIKNIKYIKKEFEYPSVIPIVLYTGKQEWNAQLEFKMTKSEKLDYQINELAKYNVIINNQIEDEELLKEKSVISKIMLIEKSLTREMLSENMNKINEEIQESSEFYTNDDIVELNKVVEVLVETFFNKNKSDKLVKKLKLKESGFMLAVIDNLYDEIESGKKDGIKIGEKRGIKIGEKRGIKIGEKRGKEDGRKEALEQIVKNMLSKEYPIETISEMTELKIEEVKKIEKKLK